MTQAETDRDPVWGPLSHPNRLDLPADAPPWRDHIYFSYWDPAAGVFGILHWNSAPNSATGKTQVTAIVNGRFFEVVEGIEAEETRYLSDAAEFDMRGAVRIHHPRLSGSLELTPRFVPADYTARGHVPPLIPSEPLHHFQQGFGIAGHLVLDGERVDIDGRGFRTRSWGYRDESLQFPEYFSLQTCMDDFDFTVLKFKWQDGTMKTDGALLREGKSTLVDDIHITRNPASLLLEAEADLESGETVRFTVADRIANTWAPMGPQRRLGPTFGEYDEFVELTADGAGSGRGHGLACHGIIRTVF
jgi:hypothetical protein